MAGAEAKLGMSLDDIIKQNEKKRDVKSRPTIRAKPTLERGNATNVRVVPRPRGVTKRAPTSLAVTIVNKGGAGRHPVTRKYIPRNEAQQAQVAAPVPRGNSNARWRHDLFSEDTARASRAQPKAKSDGAKLLISNLHHEVSDDDLVELFETIGKLKSVNVTYDNSGRSLGEAEVTFTSRADARSAKEKYNNVLLDGKKMIIQLEGGGGGDVFSRLSTGPRSGAAAGRAGGQGSRIFQQATRSGGQTTRSSARMSTRATGSMRGFKDDDDDMEE